MTRLTVSLSSTAFETGWRRNGAANTLPVALSTRLDSPRGNQPGITRVKSDPFLKNARADPRFFELLKKLNLL
jgi:hypothetical protein